MRCDLILTHAFNYSVLNNMICISHTTYLQHSTLIAGSSSLELHSWTMVYVIIYTVVIKIKLFTLWGTSL